MFASKKIKIVEFFKFNVNSYIPIQNPIVFLGI